MSDLCITKIGCGSDKARKSLLVLAIPLAFRYLWLRPRLGRLGNAKENKFFLGTALAFRYLCIIRNSHIMGLLEPEV